MKKLLFVLLFFLHLNAFSTIIYCTTLKSEATYLVYISPTRSDADIIIKKSDLKTLAKDNPDYWYFTDVKAEADIIVFITDLRSESNLKVYFINE